LVSHVLSFSFDRLCVKMSAFPFAGAVAAAAGGAYLLKSAYDERQGTWLEVRVPHADVPSDVAEALTAAYAVRKQEREPLDGCAAALSIAYQYAETMFIFPITPTTPLGEGADQMAAAGKTNAFGLVPKVQQMQSEGGAAGSVHGTLVIGGLSTTFTASQGLLLMIPNLYKIAGELLPCVIHVAARALAGQALAIFGDHSDIMAVRQTGFSLLSSHTVQESLDLALVAHISTYLSSVPFIHFFDGMRTSHEIQSIETITQEQVKIVTKLLVPFIDKFRSRSLNPNHPSVRGTAQGGDIFFQNVEAANIITDGVADCVRVAMQWVNIITGRSYDIFEYYGSTKATDVIVIMGSASGTVEELIDSYGPNAKVGVVKVRLFRPWSGRHLLANIPRSCRRIAVLDRCKENGFGEPLFTDVCATLQGCAAAKHIKIIGGRYGLASKEFTPGMAHAVFENLKSQKPQHPFTIGINDDVTHLSLTFTERNTVPDETVQCLLYGFGSDGTVGANKNAIKLIAKEAKLFSQGYFSYDALKAGGITCSHLRFGPTPIKASYEITSGCKYLAIHKKEYLKSFSADLLLSPMEPRGILVLNTPWTDPESLRKNLPLAFREMVVQRKMVVYNIDAAAVAEKSGMGRMINNIMQTVFFQLSKVMDSETAITMFKTAVEKTYRSKGAEIVRKNIEAIDMSLGYLKKFDLPDNWAQPMPGETHQTVKQRSADTPKFVTDVIDKVHLREGGDIPVSSFEPGGQVPLGMTQWAKRGVANSVPVVDLDKCTQCNKCSLICPHAVIRPFLASTSELKTAPKSFETRRSQGGNQMAGLDFRIQASPMDCTGCEVCVSSCPDNALKMRNIKDAVADGHVDNWDFAMSLPSRGNRFDKFSVKGSQFNQPLLEFSGACEGCGETPYAKLLTQLFGKRMIIANATGCTSIWGASAGWIPYTTDKETGKGPAWGNSLFEDNAEYGLGMVLGMSQRRKHLTSAVEEALKDGEAKGNAELQDALEQWYERKDEGDLSMHCAEELQSALDSMAKGLSKLPPNLDMISRNRDVLAKPSMWMMGGDGWANDIGFGGIDHVVSLGENVNIVVLDTEVYSNTGGQSSKATPLGSVAKFAQKGKRRQKKDLAGAFMNYEGVYVASCAVGANYAQCVKAFKEAEAHNGPSLVVCYSPCIEHRAKTGMSHMGLDQKAAVDCGYWPLYRHDPNLIEKGENPFQLDSKTVNGKVFEFLRTQNRYAQLQRSLPEDAARLEKELNQHLMLRHDTMKAKSEQKQISKGVSELVAGLRAPEVYVLYGSETGTAEGVARKFTRAAKDRGCAVKKLTELNDCGDLEKMDAATFVIFVATCGDGDIPANALDFEKQIQACGESSLSAHRFVLFALGDKGYPKFCEAGKVFQKGLIKAGAAHLLDMGIGNQGDEDGWETGYAEWLPKAMDAIGAPELPARDGPADPLFAIEEHSGATLIPPQLCPPGAVLASIEENRRLPPSDYERDIRHFVISNKDVDLPFHLGDAVGLFPQNMKDDVEEALAWFGYSPDTAITIESMDEDINPRLAEVCQKRTTARQLLTEVVDIFGRPSRSFYSQIAEFASIDEKRELLAISSGDKFKSFLDESMTCFDIFKKFPSAKPSLAHLLSLIPAIRYRLYSIANSADYTPGVIELTIVVNQWKTKQGAVKTGTSTKYIAELPLGARIAATMTCGTFTFPRDDLTPMVMAGLGTGIAPIRSFVQDRMYKAKVQGKKVGPMVVFYGCRHEREEFFYKEEWELYQKEGVLTNIIPAFSHDKPHYPPKMVFVNQKMEDNKELLSKYMGESNGYFYMCGLAVAAPGIEKALKTSMAEANFIKTEDGDAWIEEMKQTGRYSMESY